MEHHSPEKAKKRSSTEQEPVDYDTWASKRFSIPDDGRFRFPFSRTGLEYLFRTERKAEAEMIPQSIHDLFNNEAKKGNHGLHLMYTDYYEGVDGQTRLESIRFSTEDGLEMNGPIPLTDVKGEHKSEFQRFMCVFSKPSFR